MWARRPRRRTIRPALEHLEGRWLRSASVLPVTSALDDVGQRGTLRYAVAHAQNGDTILLTPVVAKTGITLTQGELLLGQQGLTIKAVGDAPVTISGDNQSRVFEVDGGASVALSDVTVTGGTGRAGIAGRPHEDRAGGILVDELASLTMSGCTVTANSTARLGGGIAVYGTLSASDCDVSGNQALGTYGGGIAIFFGTATVSDVNLAGNSSTVFGGGIFNFATLTLTGSTFTGNSAGIRGGGVWTSNDFGGFVTGTTTITGNIFSNNTPDAISGIYDGGPNTFL
jgi:hypothetical protein